MSTAAETEILLKAKDQASAVLEEAGKKAKQSLGNVAEAANAASEGAKKLGEHFGKEGGVGGAFLETKERADEAKESIKGLHDVLKDVIETSVKFALGGLIAKGIEGIGSGIAKSFEEGLDKAKELGEETKNLQIQTGQSAESASALISVFERYGISAGGASLALGLFSRHIESLAQETPKAAEAGKGMAGVFQRLGIEAKDAHGHLLPMEDVLLSTAEAFKKMPDGVEKTSAAMQLFGRSGKELIPFLNLGRDGIIELEQKAKELGLTLSQDNVNAIKQFGLAQKDFKEALGGIEVQIGTVVIPILTRLVEFVSRGAEAFNRVIVPAIRNFVEYFNTNFAPYIQAGIEIVSQGFTSLASIVGGALGDLLSIVSSVGQAIYDALSWINPFASHSPPLVEQVSSGVDNIVTSYQNLGQIADSTDSAKEAVKSFAGESSKALKESETSAKETLDGMKSHLTELQDALKAAQEDLSNFGKAPIEGEKAFKDQLDGIATKSDEIRLRIANIKLGNDITPDVQRLTAQLKELQLHAPQSPLGGNKQASAAFQQASRDHQNAIRGIQEQLNAVKTGGSQSDIQGLNDQLAQLSLQSEKLKLEEKLKFDPLHKQITEKLSPALKELPFDVIMKGASDARQKIDTLEPSIKTLSIAVKDQEAVVKSLTAAAQASAAASKGGGAGGGTNPIADTVKSVNEGLETSKKALKDFTDHVADVRKSIEDKVGAVVNYFKDAFNGLDLLAPFRELAKGNVTGFFGTLFSNLKIEWGGISKIFGDVETLVGGVAKKIFDFLVDKFKGIHWQDVIQNAEDLGKNILAEIVKLGTSVLESLKTTWSGIHWKDIWASIQGFGQGFIDGAVSIGANVITWLGDQWATITSADWGAIWKKAVDIGKGLVASGIDIIDHVTAFLQKTWSSIDWKLVWKAITGFVSGFSTWITTQASQLSEIVQSLKDSLTDSFKTNNDWSTTAHVAVTNLAKAVTQEKWDKEETDRGVKHFLDTLTISLHDANYAKAGDTAGNQFVDAMNAFLRSKAAAVNISKGTIQGVDLSVVVSAVELIYYGNKAAEDFIDGFVKAIVSRLATKIYNALVDATQAAVRLFKAVGSSIGQDVVNFATGGKDDQKRQDSAINKFATGSPDSLNILPKPSRDYSGPPSTNPKDKAPTNITINQTFNGTTPNPSDVASASKTGVHDAWSQVGKP